jgi:ubiquitin carboxyl-terminal hydrolase L3
MSNLVHKLGLSPSLSFHDVFSISDPELLAFVPRPAAALLLVFPVSKSYETFRMQDDAARLEYASKGESEPVIWYKQTIRNACGLIGVLHAVSNGSARGFVGAFEHFSTTSSILPRFCVVAWVTIIYADATYMMLHGC